MVTRCRVALPGTISRNLLNHCQLIDHFQSKRRILKSSTISFAFFGKAPQKVSSWSWLRLKRNNSQKWSFNKFSFPEQTLKFILPDLSLTAGLLHPPPTASDALRVPRASPEASPYSTRSAVAVMSMKIFIGSLSYGPCDTPDYKNDSKSLILTLWGRKHGNMMMGFLVLVGPVGALNTSIFCWCLTVNQGWSANAREEECTAWSDAFKWRCRCRCSSLVMCLSEDEQNTNLG